MVTWSPTNSLAINARMASVPHISRAVVVDVGIGGEGCHDAVEVEGVHGVRCARRRRR